MNIIRKCILFYQSHPYLGLVVVLAIFAFNLSLDINYPYFPRSDSGAQIIAAKALVIGKGYCDISNPWDAPFLLYPPVFSILLALPIALWGINYLAMKILVALFAMGCVILFYFLMKQFIDPTIVPLLLLVLIFSGFYHYAIRIQSEMPFIFFSLATIFFMERYASSPKVLSTHLLGVLLFLNLSQFTKLVGFSLCIAAVVYLLIKNPYDNPWRRFRMTFYKIGIISLLTILPFYMYLNRINPWYVSAKNYEHPYVKVDPVINNEKTPAGFLTSQFLMNGKNALFYFLPKCLVRDDLNMWLELDKKILPAEAFRGAAGNYWGIPSDVLRNADWPVRKELSFFLFIMLFILFVVKNITAPDYMSFYVPIYVITILPSPWAYEIPRYLVPIVPLSIFYLYQGLIVLGSLLRTLGRIFAASGSFILNPRIFACTIFITLFSLQLSMGFNKQYSDAWHANSKWVLLNEFEWIKQHTRPEDVILCVDKYLMYLFTGRKAFSFVPWEIEKEPYFFGLDFYLRVGGKIAYAIYTNGNSEITWVTSIINNPDYKLRVAGKDQASEYFTVIKFNGDDVGPTHELTSIAE